MNRDKLIYWISTGIMCLILGGSSLMYFFNYEAAAMFFKSLGYPLWMIYPLAQVAHVAPNLFL